MNDEKFDSELDALIDSCVANKKVKSESLLQKTADDGTYYRAWNNHVAAVIEPTLQEVVAKFQQKGIGVSVQRVPSHRRLGGRIPGADGISFYSSDVAERLPRSGASDYSLIFTVAERNVGTVPTVQVSCPGQRIEIVTMAKITREFVQQAVLTYLKGKQN
jgi:hypothetical protein